MIKSGTKYVEVKMYGYNDTQQSDNQVNDDEVDALLLKAKNISKNQLFTETPVPVGLVIEQDTNNVLSANSSININEYAVVDFIDRISFDSENNQVSQKSLNAAYDLLINALHESVKSDKITKQNVSDFFQSFIRDFSTNTDRHTYTNLLKLREFFKYLHTLSLSYPIAGGICGHCSTLLNLLKDKVIEKRLNECKLLTASNAVEVFKTELRREIDNSLDNLVKDERAKKFADQTRIDTNLTTAITNIRENTPIRRLGEDDASFQTRKQNNRNNAIAEMGSIANALTTKKDNYISINKLPGEEKAFSSAFKLQLNNDAKELEIQYKNALEGHNDFLPNLLSQIATAFKNAFSNFSFGTYSVGQTLSQFGALQNPDTVQVVKTNRQQNLRNVVKAFDEPKEENPVYKESYAMRF